MLKNILFIVLNETLKHHPLHTNQIQGQRQKAKQKAMMTLTLTIIYNYDSSHDTLTQHSIL